MGFAFNKKKYEKFQIYFKLRLKKKILPMTYSVTFNTELF